MNIETIITDKKEIIIFDLDGLLVNTEEIFFKTVKAVSKRFGRILELEDYKREVLDAGNEITSILNINELQKERFTREIYDRYSRHLVPNVQIKNDAINCLKTLSSKYRLVLVTGSKRYFADSLLSKFHITKYFYEVYTRDDGFPPKPNPRVFKHILEKYGVNNWECIVIEDSNRGIQAALKLSIPSIIIPSSYTLEKKYSSRVTRLKKLSNISLELIENIYNRNRPTADHTLVNLYKDSMSRLDDLFKTYEDIYGLKENIHIDTEVSPEAFEYAKKRSYFLILAMITKDKRVYFQRCFESGHLSMTLPGSGINIDKNESIIQAIERLANI